MLTLIASIIWTPIRPAAWSPGTFKPPLPTFDASWKIIFALSSAGDCQSLASSLLKVLPEDLDWNFDEIRWYIVVRFNVDIVHWQQTRQMLYQRKALMVAMRIRMLYYVVRRAYLPVRACLTFQYRSTDWCWFNWLRISRSTTTINTLLQYPTDTPLTNISMCLIGTYLLYYISFKP